jgi:hypothetical protein
VHAHAADTQQLAHIVPPQPADAPADSQKRGTIAPGIGPEPRRCLREQRMQRAREALQQRLPVRQGRRLAARVRGERCQVARRETQVAGILGERDGQQVARGEP